MKASPDTSAAAINIPAIGIADIAIVLERFFLLLSFISGFIGDVKVILILLTVVKIEDIRTL
jgi:hypothetical protein